MYSTEKIINALYNEYSFLCHDDFNPDEDPTPEEYREMIKKMNYDELVEETSTSEEFTLEQYLETWT